MTNGKSEFEIFAEKIFKDYGASIEFDLRNYFVENPENLGTDSKVIKNIVLSVASKFVVETSLGVQLNFMELQKERQKTF